MWNAQKKIWRVEQNCGFFRLALNIKRIQKILPHFVLRKYTGIHVKVNVIETEETSLTLILGMMIILSLHLGYKFMLLIAGRPLQRLTETIRGEKKKEIPDLSERSCSDREHGFLFNTKTDFPQLPTNKAGIPPCPTEPSASRKVQSQWEIPFSFHPRHAPTATLASGTSAPVPAPVQRKELHTDSAADTSLVLQRASDLLADFPPLLPPREPFSSGVKCVTGNPMV